ncbi:MAG: hypothetical protein ACI9ME_000445 [Ilumatobacter sp.]|jgi:hypothetical protein|tara:strand:- start:99 stop:284 length:186 start_codon:yes stop_codon:yes gene_type:complete
MSEGCLGGDLGGFGRVVSQNHHARTERVRDLTADITGHSEVRGFRASVREMRRYHGMSVCP